MPAVPRSTAVPSPEAGDLTLTRLLSIARLTPAQAVALGTDLLAGLDDPGTGAGPRLRRDALRIGRDGRAYVVDSRPIDAGAAAPNGAGPATAATLLDQLRAATRSPAADGTPTSALERAAAEARSPGGHLAFAAAILREADAPDGARARAELAKLVAMVASDVAPAVASDPAPRRLRPRRPPRAIARAAVTRSWKWVLSGMLLVAVVAVEITLLHDRIGRDVQAVLDAGRSEATATSAPGLPRVVPPEPTAVGAIRRVGLRPVEPCTPGAACVLRTQVMVLPRADPQTITWDLRILDRCTGAAVTVPGGTVTVPPHGDRADAVGTVPLPPGDALAVLAVTTQPFSAASVPVNVPDNGACAG